MSQAVEYGDLEDADRARDEYAEYVCPLDDDRRQKTVHYVSDVPDDVMAQIEADASESRAVEKSGSVMATLNAAELEKIRDLDGFSESVSNLSWRSAKGVFEREGLSDKFRDHIGSLTDHDDPMEGAKETVERLKEQGVAGGARDEGREEERQRRKQQEAAQKVQEEGCNHARNKCENGHSEACEFLKNACGYDRETVDKILGDDRDLEDDQETEQVDLDGSSISVAPEEAGALRRAWTAYKAATSNLSDVLDEIRDGVSTARLSMKTINEVRDNHGQDDLHPKKLHDLLDSLDSLPESIPETTTLDHFGSEGKIDEDSRPRLHPDAVPEGRISRQWSNIDLPAAVGPLTLDWYDRGTVRYTHPSEDTVGRLEKDDTTVRGETLYRATLNPEVGRVESNATQGPKRVVEWLKRRAEALGGGRDPPIDPVAVPDRRLDSDADGDPVEQDADAEGTHRDRDGTLRYTGPDNRRLIEERDERDELLNATANYRPDPRRWPGVEETERSRVAPKWVAYLDSDVIPPSEGTRVKISLWRDGLWKLRLTRPDRTDLVKSEIETPRRAVALAHRTISRLSEGLRPVRGRHGIPLDQPAIPTDRAERAAQRRNAVETPSTQQAGLDGETATANQQASLAVDTGVRDAQGRESRVESERNTGGLMADTRDSAGRGVDGAETGEATDFSEFGATEQAQQGLDAVESESEPLPGVGMWSREKGGTRYVGRDWKVTVSAGSGEAKNSVTLHDTTAEETVDLGDFRDAERARDFAFEVTRRLDPTEIDVDDQDGAIAAAAAEARSKVAADDGGLTDF